MSITWSTPPSTEDTTRLEEIVSTLVTSLNRAERNRQLLEEAETDPLTGLANRRRASRVLASALNRAERNGEFIAVAVVDLDGFKQVNDGLGHDVGDLVLQMAADVLRAEARSYDLPARLGGDEFLVVLPSTDAIGARAFGSRVVANVAETCAAHLPPRVRVTASVGVAVFPGDATGPDELIRAADEALYAAKAAGRNCVKLFDGRTRT